MFTNKNQIATTKPINENTHPFIYIFTTFLNLRLARIGTLERSERKEEKSASLCPLGPHIEALFPLFLLLNIIT